MQRTCGWGNTLLNNLVIPSLALDATSRSYKDDALETEALVMTTETGVLIAEGNGLLRWARKCIDVVSIPMEQARLRKDLALAKISEGSTVTQLEEHLFSQWRMWQLLLGNDSTVVDDFWARVLASMPTKPDQAPLSQGSAYVWQIVS